MVLKASVNRAFSTSMEVGVSVWAEDTSTGERRRSNRAYYTFVAVDQSGRPIPVRPVEPETDAERERYEAAGRRRELRLVLAGRLPMDAAGSLREHLAEVAAEHPGGAGR